MRRILSLAAVALLLAVSGCDRAITEPYGPLTGTWRYQAAGWRQFNSQHACSLDVVIRIRQEGNSIEGVQTEEAPVFCTGPDGTVRQEYTHFGTVIGEIQDGRIHFSNGGNWHSFGEVAADRIEGYLESYGSIMNGPPQVQRSGSFVLERISNEGYHGPGS